MRGLRGRARQRGYPPDGTIGLAGDRSLDPMLISHRAALIIHIGLREYRTQLALARACGPTWRSPRTAFGLGLHHEHLRAVHLYIEIGNRRASHGRERELFGAMDVLLLPGFNVFSNRLSDALDRFGRDL